MITIRLTRVANPQQGTVKLRFAGHNPDEPTLVGIELSSNWGVKKATSVQNELVYSRHNSRAQHAQTFSVSIPKASLSNRTIWSYQISASAGHYSVLSYIQNSLYPMANIGVGHNVAGAMGVLCKVARRAYFGVNTPTTIGYSSGREHGTMIRLRGGSGSHSTSHNRIAYAPSSAMYVCKWPHAPKLGHVTIRLTPKHTGKLYLTYSKECVWELPGGLIRSGDDIPTLDRKIPIEPQIQKAYIMQHTITCKRLSDNTDILITSFSHAFERGQFAATGSIRFCSRIDMERAMGQELLVSVNGYEYVVICEQPSTSNKFNSASYSASIRGRFAQLSAPYARETNYTNPTPRTLAGIMSDALTNSGWTLDNQMIDYPVPKGTFSYRGLTPAGALLRIAQSVGGILDFNDITRTVSVIPEWPINPWDADGAVCDVILNDSLILEHNTRQTISPEHTAVFVRGEQQGVACKIKRAGTQGDQYAYDVVDSLITDNQAARQRGTCELARSGNKKVSEIRTKLTAALPPIRPGMLIGIRYSDSLYKATCDSASISASINAQGAISVNQSIRVVANV